ncbi:helix-turn-helix transcriptional regulator [Streptomyces sp. NRRL B-1347]|uniref:helix-turn-helix transcriptional regulator n=1 Tax=Streptomyces sp. NRRL B-1347 TaxID=1476877 RepID=UPI000A77F382|nr:LuxR C-terminal-related transcriptional regulator [Streptomyces sp. NRRL B-1347]
MPDGAMRETDASLSAHPPHAHDVLCEQARALYARALRDGRVAADAPHADCLRPFGLLHADPGVPGRLLPAAPAVALPRLLADIERRVAGHRALAARLAAAFEPFIRAEPVADPDSAAAHLTVLKGVPRIRTAVRQALADAREELLAIQPSRPRPRLLPHDEPWRMAEFVARGGQPRTLARAPVACAPPPRSHPLGPAVDGEARTLDELPPCLIVFDRRVAFLPADAHGEIAFEVRSPALISYVATAFDVLWRLARPLYREDAPPLPDQAISPVQLEIARLLTEGLTDTEIASRTGMNVRTVRVHIAKVAQLLGSTSRTQLGYLISRSGLLERRSPRLLPPDR